MLAVGNEFHPEYFGSYEMLPRDGRVAVGMLKEFVMNWAAVGPGVIVWMLEQG